MASREISELTRGMAEKARLFLDASEAAGLVVLILCTFRPTDEQARLFRQGRTLRQIEAKADELRNDWDRPDLADLLMSVGPQSGRRIVTNAGPGQSSHNYRGAFDMVVCRDGKPVWEDDLPEDKELWEVTGSIAESCGLEWAGRWGRFRELGHMEDPGLRWQTRIREGRVT